MRRIKIFNLEPDGYAPAALEILRSFADVTNGPCARHEIISKIENHDVLIVRLAHRIDQPLIEQMQGIKIIASATTGIDHIDLMAANERGLNIISLKGDTDFLENIHATAEHTWGMILALLRHLPAAHKHACAGGWNRDLFRGQELHGKTLGIIGLGRLGRKVAGYGLAFGMRVLANDIKMGASLSGVEICDLQALLAQSDIVTIHVPLDDSTRNFINAKQINAMKANAVIINTSRGGVIDETALLQSLVSGPLAGAALDVLNGEPETTGSPLVHYAANHDNLILTPHIGGATMESMEKAEQRIAQKLKEFFSQIDGCP